MGTERKKITWGQNVEKTTTFLGKNDHFAKNRTLPKSLHGVSHAFPEPRKKTTKNNVTFFFFSFQTNTFPPPAFNSLSWKSASTALSAPRAETSRSQTTTTVTSITRTPVSQKTTRATSSSIDCRLRRTIGSASFVLAATATSDPFLARVWPGMLQSVQKSAGSLQQRIHEHLPRHPWTPKPHPRLLQIHRAKSALPRLLT